MTLKRIAIALGILLVIVLVAAGGGIAWLLTANLKPIVEDYASEAFGRPVTFDSLTVAWGNPLAIEAKGLKVANASWASAPAMVSVDGISALLDPWSLLSGAPRFEKVRLVKPVVVLERGEGENRNWRVGQRVPAVPIAPGSDAVVIPHYRAQFPSLFDFEMTGGQVIYKSKSYNMQLDLHEASIKAADDEARATVKAEGTYNGTPVDLSADTDSFSAMRDTTKPFGVNLVLHGGGAEIDFKGGMRDPLGFDGVEGPITLTTPKLGDLMKLLTVDIPINPGFTIAGAFNHARNHWEVKQSKGKIATSAFTGDLMFDEGAKGEPDNLTAVLHFDNLVLPAIIASAEKKAAAPTDVMAVPLVLDTNRGTNLDITLDAGQIVAGNGRIGDFGLTAKIVSGKATLDRLVLDFAGGHIDATGEATSVKGGTRVVEHAKIVKAEAGQLALYVSALAGKLTGRINGGFDLDMTGDTFGHALRASQGHMVFAMVDGSVARDLMEKLSTNVMNLFRRGSGAVPVSCFLAISDFRNGLATIIPIRLRSSDGTLIGRGNVNVLGKFLDLTIQSDAATTGFFSLDIPIRISGPFANPAVDPHFGSAATTRQALASANPLAGLSGDLRGLAESNACLR